MTQPPQQKQRKFTVAFDHGSGKQPVQHCGDGVGLVKMNSKQLDTWRQELRDQLPHMTDKEIRRHSLTHEKAMFLEMTEEGFGESAEYITDLIRLNHEMWEEVGPDKSLWHHERLKDNPACMDALRTGLCSAQEHAAAGRQKEQCAALLALAIKFMLGDENWWWLAEQLFLRTIEAADRYIGDGGRSKAVAHYTYGHFLLQQMDEIYDAEKQLQLARSISEGHPWTADDDALPAPPPQGHQRRFSKVPQLPIFVETCKLLYKTLLLMAERVREDDGEESIRLCKQALKRAEQANRQDAVVDSLYQLGLSYQAVDDQLTAISIFQQHYALALSLVDHDAMCNSHIQTGQCFKALGDAAQTLNYLELFRKCADKFRLEGRRGEAHRYLGEYHLYQENPEKARTHLNASFSVYHKLSMGTEMEEVRSLACIAEGQCIMPMYCRLILESSVPTKLRQLVKWKDSHIPFWLGGTHHIASPIPSEEMSTPSKGSVASTWSPSPSVVDRPTLSQRPSEVSSSSQRYSVLIRRPLGAKQSIADSNISPQPSYYSEEQELFME